MEHWRYVAPLLVSPVDDADYQSLVESLDAILDAGGADENSPLAGLASMIGDLIEICATMLSNSNFLSFTFDLDFLSKASKRDLSTNGKLAHLAGRPYQNRLHPMKRYLKALALHRNAWL